jgi:hypothetical protein
MTDDPFDAGDVRTLALAVFNAAIVDCGSASETEREPAIAFLTEETGEWGASFNAWCAVADIDPSWARDKFAPHVSRQIRKYQEKLKKPIDEVRQ